MQRLRPLMEAHMPPVPRTVSSLALMVFNIEP